MEISEAYYLTVFKQAIILSLSCVVEESYHLWTNTVILRALVPFITFFSLQTEHAQVCIVTYN